MNKGVLSFDNNLVEINFVTKLLIHLFTHHEWLTVSICLLNHVCNVNPLNIELLDLCDL